MSPRNFAITSSTQVPSNNYLTYLAENLFLSNICYICQIYLYTMLSELEMLLRQ